MLSSQTYHETLSRGLSERLATARAKLPALTPAPARGKRQIQEEVALTKTAEAILRTHHLQGLLSYTFERQESEQIRFAA